jgi:hypothetical protein
VPKLLPLYSPFEVHPGYVVPQTTAFIMQARFFHKRLTVWYMDPDGTTGQPFMYLNSVWSLNKAQCVFFDAVTGQLVFTVVLTHTSLRREEYTAYGSDGAMIWTVSIAVRLFHRPLSSKQALPYLVAGNPPFRAMVLQFSSG